MALYTYIKRPVVPVTTPASITGNSDLQISPSTTMPPKSAVRPLLTRFKAILPPTLITIGSLIIANVAWPIVHHQLISAPTLQKVEFVSPIRPEFLGSNPIITPPSILTDNTMPQVLGADLDYSDARNWFPSAQFQDSPTQDVVYYLSIPKLKIDNAKVLTGGTDLSKSLIQYPGTAQPGQAGAPVVFGHSMLRRFYNPTTSNPDRYQSIFSTVMTLKNGDRIYINYDGIEYTYEVYDLVEVKPDDLFILEQHYAAKDLKLITCTPEGTYLKRGVVLARLVNLNTSASDRLGR